MRINDDGDDDDDDDDDAIQWLEKLETIQNSRSEWKMEEECFSGSTTAIMRSRLRAAGFRGSHESPSPLRCASEVTTVWRYINFIIIFFTLGIKDPEGFGKNRRKLSL